MIQVDRRISRARSMVARALSIMPPWPPIALGPMQPLLDRMIRFTLERRPGLTDRLGDKVNTCFAIDAKGLPFGFLLRLDPDHMMLRASTPGSLQQADACISGDVSALLAMVDGQSDGDSMFFNRTLSICGDTEAVVRLRNALDDLEGSVLEDIADFFGAPGRLFLHRVRGWSSTQEECN